MRHIASVREKVVAGLLSTKVVVGFLYFALAPGIGLAALCTSDWGPEKKNSYCDKEKGEDHSVTPDPPTHCYFSLFSNMGCSNATVATVDTITSYPFGGGLCEGAPGGVSVAAGPRINLASTWSC